MSKMTDSEDFDPAMGHMAPPWARRFFSYLGVDTYTDDLEDD